MINVKRVLQFWDTGSEAAWPKSGSAAGWHLQITTSGKA